MKLLKNSLWALILMLFIASCGISKNAKTEQTDTDGMQAMTKRINDRDSAMRAHGADFIALGTNPNWVLMVNKADRIIEFNLEGEENQKYFLNADEYIEVYHIDGQNSTSNIIINTSEKECTNVKTGEVLPYQVVVDYNGKSYVGCGKNLRGVEDTLKMVPASLNGAWELQAIQSTPVKYEEGMFHPILDIRLKEMIAIGTTGCNNFQAEIIIDGNSMKFPPFPMTQRFCPNSVEGPLVKEITKVSRYDLQRDVLLMYNSEGIEVLRFKRLNNE